MKKLTVAQYALENNVTTNTVYKYIKLGKVKSIKKMVDNREVLMIVDESKEQENNDIKLGLHDIESNNYLQKNYQINQELITFMQDVTYKMTTYSDKIVEYAELAGQTKLLTDSETKTKEEYFKVLQEKAELKAKIALQQEKIKEMERQLESKSNKVPFKQILKNFIDKF